MTGPYTRSRTSSSPHQCPSMALASAALAFRKPSVIGRGIVPPSPIVVCEWYVPNTRRPLDIIGAHFPRCSYLHRSRQPAWPSVHRTTKLAMHARAVFYDLFFLACEKKNQGQLNIVSCSTTNRHIVDREDVCACALRKAAVQLGADRCRIFYMQGLRWSGSALHRVSDCARRPGASLVSQ